MPVFVEGTVLRSFSFDHSGPRNLVSPSFLATTPCSHSHDLSGVSVWLEVKSLHSSGQFTTFVEFFPTSQLEHSLEVVFSNDFLGKLRMQLPALVADFELSMSLCLTSAIFCLPTVRNPIHSGEPSTFFRRIWPGRNSIPGHVSRPDS
jgi:hypothetical protein